MVYRVYYDTTEQLKTTYEYEIPDNGIKLTFIAYQEGLIYLDQILSTLKFTKQDHIGSRKLTNTIEVAKISIMEQSKQNDQVATKIDIVKLGNELKTHMGVLFERASEQTVLLAEQLEDTNHRVNNLESKMDMVIETIADVKVVVNEIKDGLDNKVDKKDFVKLEKQVTGLAARVG